MGEDVTEIRTLVSQLNEILDTLLAGIQSLSTASSTQNASTMERLRQLKESFGELKTKLESINDPLQKVKGKAKQALDR